MNRRCSFCLEPVDRDSYRDGYVHINECTSTGRYSNNKFDACTEDIAFDRHFYSAIFECDWRVSEGVTYVSEALAV